MSRKFRLRTFLATAGLLILIHAAFAAALIATVDFEAMSIAPLATSFAVPSFLLYAMLESRRSHHSWRPEGIFLVSLLPFSLHLGYCSFYSPEGKELAMLLLGLYVLPALLALSVRLVLSGQN